MRPVALEKGTLGFYGKYVLISVRFSFSFSGMPNCYALLLLERYLRLPH